jgi:signal transduction histidine kinase
MLRGYPLDSKPHLQWITFFFAVTVELYTATIGILLVLAEPGIETPYAVFSYTTYPRVVLLVICSFLVGGRKFWQQYIKIDVFLVMAITSIISFVFMQNDDPDALKNNPILLHSSIAYAIMLFFLIGNYRVMLKWYPWTRKRFYAYKLVRFYAILFFTIQQIVARQIQNSSAVGFFAATLGLLNIMMTFAVIKEGQVKVATRAAKKKREAEEQLLDDKV